jgi:ABC-2 type transport system permease protein
MLPAYFAKQHEDYTQIKIGLMNNPYLLKDVFPNSSLLVETLENKTTEDIKQLVTTDQLDGVVHILNIDSARIFVQYYSSKQPSVFLINQIKSSIEKSILKDKLSIYGIDDIYSIFNVIKNSIEIETIKVGVEKNQIVNNEIQRPLCMVFGLTVYMFIFLFSSHVMRGVLEEKSNRIIELIITSISPVKFMAGKIAGIALLGLTQIVCWITIIYGVVFFLSNGSDILSINDTNSFVNQKISQEEINKILININQIDFSLILPAFFFFFIGGYLLYSSVFAAIAAAANHSDEIQQITLIVTLPLILSVIVLSNTINSPDSTLSYWFSIIPFTSPVVMMGRIVYGVPVKDISLSISLLVVTVFIIIWLSGKVYKTVILFSGKKITGKEILSWVRRLN